MDPSFVEPPEKYRKRRSYEWTRIYDMIKSNPGQWLLLAEQGSHSTYTAVTQGKVSTFHPEKGVEMRTANNKGKPRTCDLYCRYNPDFDKSLTVKEREKVWIQIRKIEKEKKMNVSTVESQD